VPRIFHRVLIKAGLPGHFTPHCLRHTFASILILEEGSLIEYVSRMLGHADIRLTVATYGRWLRPASKAVNRLCLGQTATNGNSYPALEGENVTKNAHVRASAEGPDAIRP